MMKMKSKLVKLNLLKDTLSLDENDNEINDIFFKDRYNNEDWKKLKLSLKKGYKPQNHDNGFITVVKIWFSDFYLVYDGSHRVKLLKEIYGGEHQIEVKVISKLRAIGEILVLIIVLPFMFIKKIRNGI